MLVVALVVLADERSTEKWTDYYKTACCLDCFVEFGKTAGHCNNTESALSVLIWMVVLVTNDVSVATVMADVVTVPVEIE